MSLSRVCSIAIWLGGGLAFSGIAYLLWWLHNDYPYGACLLAAVFYLGQLRFIGWLITGTVKRDFDEMITDYDTHREVRLDMRMKALYRRLEEDEQKIDELDATDDSDDFINGG